MNAAVALFDERECAGVDWDPIAGKLYVPIVDGADEDDEDDEDYFELARVCMEEAWQNLVAE